MARGRSRSAYHSSIATRSVLRSVIRPLPKLVLSLDDRRTYYPDVFVRPAGALSRLARQVRVSSRPTGVTRNVLRGADVFGFTIPKKVALCVRRKQRRSVLFAMERTGKGSRSRVRRRNEWSEVRC